MSWNTTIFPTKIWLPFWQVIIGGKNCSSVCHLEASNISTLLSASNAIIDVLQVLGITPYASYQKLSIYQWANKGYHAQHASAPWVLHWKGVHHAPSTIGQLLIIIHHITMNIVHITLHRKFVRENPSAMQRGEFNKLFQEWVRRKYPSSGVTSEQEWEESWLMMPRKVLCPHSQGYWYSLAWALQNTM